jgi:DnaD/phage-associated family protein
MSDPWFIDLEDRHRLGWMLLILNGADDQGRFLMNGRLMKSMLFPADDIPAAEVLAMLDGFARSGKVHAYEREGVRYGQIVNWWKYQIGSEWMAPSRHPAPDGWVDRFRVHVKGGKGIIETSPCWGNKHRCGFAPQESSHIEGAEAGSGKPLPEPAGDDLGKRPGSTLPGRLPGSEVKGDVKDKGEGKLDDEVDFPAAVSFENPFAVYEQNVGPLTAAVSERIKLAETDYTTAWVMEAIRLAARRNKRRWDYVEGILRSWQRDGKDNGEKQEQTYAQELVAAGYTLPEQIPVEWLA